MSGIIGRSRRTVIIGKRLNAKKWDLKPEVPSGISLATDSKGNLLGIIAIPVNPQDLEPLAPAITRQYDHHIEKVSDPAAGAQLDFSFPADQTWIAWGILLKIVADAGVANRNLAILHTDGTNDGRFQPVNFTHTASVTRKYNGFPHASSLGNDTGQSTINFAFSPMYAEGGDHLLTNFSNIESGDQISEVVITCQRVFGSVD